MRKKPLAKLGALVLAATLLTSAVGCASDDESAQSGAAKKDPTDIKVWIRASGPDEGITAIIDKFNKEQDEVKVSYEYYGENYASVVQMAIAAGNPPDIMEASGGITVNSLAKQGNIIPLGNAVTDELKAKLHPDTLKPEEFYYKDELYSVPVRISAYRLLYNKDLFQAAGLDPEKPPATLEEMREAARKITEAGKGEYYGFGLPLGVAQIWERIIDPINIAMGVGDRYGFNSSTGKYEFESNKRLFNYYLDLKKDGSLFPGYQTLGIDPLRANFAQGKIGMYIDGNWMMGSYATQMSAKANWDAAPIPVFADGESGKYWAEGGVNWVITNSKNSEAAKKFYTAWLGNQELANQFMPVPRTDLTANNPDNLPTSKYNLQGLKYSMETSDLQIPVFEPHKFISLEGDDRNKVLTNLFAVADTQKDFSTSVDNALADLNKRYTAALEKAVQNGSISPESIKPAQ
ncbi:MAG: extracellular solute-binding protein family 1 [Paenibacillaceae bacterium]|jgi:multiple sugar transport system substrate-binding protein|nr:extracellular solute-binding protein family 1 [Paenibacillaceae bacterium]